MSVSRADPAVVISDGAAEPRFTVAAVAHRLGIAPATLRTWDRRYGLGPGAHVAGAHRRYSSSDLARLQVMRRLVLQGVTPAEAARAALAGPEPAGDLPERLGSRGGPGGRVLALPGADGTVRGLGRAAMALDAQAVVTLVRGAVERHGVVHTWEHVLRPVLAAVGSRWEQTGEGVEVEHLLSDCIATVLRGTADRPIEGRAGRPVLLACGPDEQHALPLHALSAGLAERGISARTLGPAVPGHALQAAVRRTAPALLFVWSQDPGTADSALLCALPVTRPPTALVVGGPGWVPERLPQRITMATDLGHALELADRALGA